MFCSSCGKQLVETANFCPACGGATSAVSASAAPPGKLEPSLPEPRSNNRVGILFLAVVFVVGAWQLQKEFTKNTAPAEVPTGASSASTTKSYSGASSENTSRSGAGSQTLSSEEKITLEKVRATGTTSLQTVGVPLHEHLIYHELYDQFGKREECVIALRGLDPKDRISPAKIHRGHDLRIHVGSGTASVWGKPMMHEGAPFRILVGAKSWETKLLQGSRSGVKDEGLIESMLTEPRIKKLDGVVGNTEVAMVYDTSYLATALKIAAVQCNVPKMADIAAKAPRPATPATPAPMPQPASEVPVATREEGKVPAATALISIDYQNSAEKFISVDCATSSGLLSCRIANVWSMPAPLAGGLFKLTAYDTYGETLYQRVVSVNIESGQSADEVMQISPTVARVAISTP